MVSTYLKGDNTFQSKKIKGFRKNRAYPLFLDDGCPNISSRARGFHIKIFYDPTFSYKISVLYDYYIPTEYALLDKKSCNIKLPVLKTSIERKVIAQNVNNKEVTYYEDKLADVGYNFLELFLKYDDFPIVIDDRKTYYYAKIDLEYIVYDLGYTQDDFQFIKEKILSIFHELFSENHNNEDNSYLHKRLLKLLWQLVCIVLRPGKGMIFSLPCDSSELRDMLSEYSISMPLGWIMDQLIDPDKNKKYTDKFREKLTNLLVFSAECEIKYDNVFLFHSHSSIVDGEITYYYKYDKIDERVLSLCSKVTIYFRMKVKKWVNYFSLVPILLVIIAGGCSISIITSSWENISSQLTIFISYFILFLAYCYTHITLRHNGYSLPRNLLLRISIFIIVFIMVFSILGRVTLYFFN